MTQKEKLDQYPYCCKLELAHTVAEEILVKKIKINKNSHLNLEELIILIHFVGSPISANVKTCNH